MTFRICSAFRSWLYLSNSSISSINCTEWRFTCLISLRRWWSCDLSLNTYRLHHRDLFVSEILVLHRESHGRFVHNWVHGNKKTIVETSPRSFDVSIVILFLSSFTSWQTFFILRLLTLNQRVGTVWGIIRRIFQSESWGIWLSFRLGFFRVSHPVWSFFFFPRITFEVTLRTIRVRDYDIFKRSYETQWSWKTETNIQIWWIRTHHWSKWMTIILRYVDLERKRNCIDSSIQVVNPHEHGEFVTRVNHEYYELLVIFYVVLECNNARIVFSHVKIKSRQWLQIIIRTRKISLHMEYAHTLQSNVIIGIMILLSFSRPEK